MALPPRELDRDLQPRMRGTLHQYSLGVFVTSCVLLIVLAGSARARLAMSVYAVGLTGCLTASAVYHRGHWSPRTKAWLGRIDHSAIFLLIAGSYTPMCLLVLTGPLAMGLLIGVWCGALAGIGLTLAWWSPPAWAEVMPYLALGWAAIIAIPAINAAIGWGAVLLMVSGGLLYSAGAIVYGRRRPNPFPSVFGYHEIFHACTVLAAAAHAVLLYVWVLPRTRG